MCGIAGIINLDGENVSAEILSAMNSAQEHRGPDEDDIYVNKNVGLAHRRLSIIDLSGGKQPLSNEDGSVWIVFNGEIYNHRELRPALEAKGHKFRTNCDTEVIVHLYEEHGADCLPYLNGMFAFAIYDLKQEEILVARDRLGQKPLVYFETAKRLVFSSELQSIRKHPDMPGEFNLQAVHDYLSLQYVPSPHTIFKGVNKLPPGHFLELDIAKRSAKVQRFWTIDYSYKNNISFDDAKHQLRKLLEDAVEKRLMADVPYGAFLSGGIDSTIVVSIMARICDQPVQTFTIGFDESKYDERNFANIAVQGINKHGKFPLDHHEKVVQPNDFSVVEKLVKHYGEPFSDASMLPTYLLSRFTREHVTVALSGDGADELFAGYNRYLVMRFSLFADFLPLGIRKNFFGWLRKILPPKTEERTFTGKIQRILQITSSDPEHRYLDLISRFDEEMKKRVYGDQFADFSPSSTHNLMQKLFSKTTSPDFVEKVMETDLHSYLNGDILAKVDIASMANSLEVRSPYMDHRVAEFAASLPLVFKQDGMTRKHILREAFREYLPRDLMGREKMGFGVPIAAWFRGKWDKPLREHLLEGESVAKGFFKKDAIEEMIRKHQRLKADYSYALWALLIFELFLADMKNS